MRYTSDFCCGNAQMVLPKDPDGRMGERDLREGDTKLLSDG